MRRRISGAVHPKEQWMAGADSVEKLEDVIVRSAEQVAGQMRAAKEAISTVIFGQERVVENTLVTILSGGHALLIGVPGLAKTKLVMPSASSSPPT
jgi:MoxR-like ATPase